MSALDPNEMLVLASELLKSDRPSDKATAGEIKRFAAELTRLQAIEKAAHNFVDCLTGERESLATQALRELIDILCDKKTPA